LRNLMLKHRHASGDDRMFLKNPWLHFFLSGAAALVLVLYFNQPHGATPALGPLLSPFRGLWNHRVSNWEVEDQGQTLSLPGLQGSVKIQVDRDQIKHIFAESDDDLYFAQGYVLASERLWEMEFLSRVAAGRLSEVMGKRTLEFDRYFTKLGLPQAAKESALQMMNDPLTAKALRSYAAGVNAFIDQLKPEDDPFEFKLLGIRPEAWVPENAAYLLKYMAYDLSGHNRELPLSRSRSRISRTDFDSLFPLNFDVPEPIVPKGAKFNFEARAGAPPSEEFLPDFKALDPVLQPDPSNGSNNWAISGKKSATGRPILSNDIHLSLSLPALWYEMQLHSPTQNVYGITLPGAPGVILGFNSKVAWGVTNGGSDVMDWYQLRYRDDNRSEYLFEGSWRPIISREVEIKVRNEAPLKLLLRETHLGPVVYDQSETPLNPTVPRGLALKWGALEGSNELKNFLQLNRAKSVSQCREAIDTFQTPNQNFLCADAAGDIGLWHMGRFPVRWRGQGRMISDGSSAGYEWRSWLPRTEIPMSKNPARGFLSSANQMPYDETYPHYLGWPFESPYRAIRINEILREKKLFTPQDFIEMQGDTLSVLARTSVPVLVKALEGIQLEERQSQALEVLRAWNFRYDVETEAPALFETWLDEFENLLWGPHFPDRYQYQFPSLARTFELIESDPNSKWFDDPATPATERFKDVALKSFKSAFAANEKSLGNFKPGKWAWSKYQKTELQHIAKIPGLGSAPFAGPGVAEAIFANKGKHGPVWKLVVALGPRPQAWSIYPGGQSGDPSSRHYDDFIEPWKKNELKPVTFLSDDKDQNPRLFKMVEVKPMQEKK
jgi:penicillin amidase